jgi:hypothetical protein
VSATASRLTSTARLASSKKAVTKSGKGKVKIRLRSAKRLKKAPKVVVTVRSGKSKARTVKVRAR